VAHYNYISIGAVIGCSGISIVGMMHDWKDTACIWDCKRCLPLQQLQGWCLTCELTSESLEENKCEKTPRCHFSSHSRRVCNQPPCVFCAQAGRQAGCGLAITNLEAKFPKALLVAVWLQPLAFVWKLLSICWRPSRLLVRACPHQLSKNWSCWRLGL